MRGTRVPAIVPSDFRSGTEVVGRLGPSWVRTSSTTRNREPATARTELGGRAGPLRMPTAAAARYRRPSARAAWPAAHYGSPSRYLGASCGACAPRYARVRSWRSRAATGTPREAGALGHEKISSTCQRWRVDQLLERTWATSNDQAPANALSSAAGESNKAHAAHAQSFSEQSRHVTTRSRRGHAVPTAASHAHRPTKLKDPRNCSRSRDTACTTACSSATTARRTHIHRTPRPPAQKVDSRTCDKYTSLIPHERRMT
jgi:hypothetical protein